MQLEVRACRSAHVAKPWSAVVHSCRAASTTTTVCQYHAFSNVGCNHQHAFMQVLDRVPMQRTGDIHRYCITATGGPLKVTLVWADYPPSPSAAVMLVNDLDLTVYADSLNGHGLYGNGAQPDRLNNVEQVCLAEGLASELAVKHCTLRTCVQQMC